jgi:uncharacterized cupin superfamily protein
MKNFSKLSKKIAEGRIYKSKEIEITNCPGITGKLIISYLVLLPGSKVKYHTHTNDSEYYIIITSNMKVLFCQKGEGHKLENNSLKNMIVLSIKVFDSI